MQNALRLKAGDILIFGKTREGELLLGGRARTASDKDRKAPPRTRKTTEEKQVIKSEHGSPPLLRDADIARARCAMYRHGTGQSAFAQPQDP